MKKLLVRSGLSPFDNYSPDYVLTHAKILGNNSGNMLYAYGVWRSLMVEDTELETTCYKYRFSDEEIEEINRDYAGFVIPLANAFRDNFIPELQGLTDVIKKLTIPVYVIGVGVNFPYEPDLSDSHLFDDPVREFVSAVLEKSSIIGVRGEITCEYLQHLGFIPEKHMTPIGCPSMYTYGATLPSPRVNIDRDSKVCINHSTQAPDNILDFVNRTIGEFPNHTMILQTKKEYDFVYAGASYIQDSQKPFPCKSMLDAMYRDNRIRFFINVPSWYEFIRSSDFCIGPRLHGNIAAVLNGVPSIILPKDARMRELTDFHRLPCALPDQICADTDIHKLIEQTDYTLPLGIQKKNFDHYVDFLNLNNLPNIYSGSSSPESCPFDRRIETIAYEQGVGTLFGCGREEALHRLNTYFGADWREKKSLIQKADKLSLQLTENRHETARLRREKERLAQRMDSMEAEFARSLLLRGVRKIERLVRGNVQEKEHD